MTAMRTQRWLAMVQKELREYRLSLLWTPVIIALVLTVLMLLSVLLANRISAMGDAFFEVVMTGEMEISPVITIDLDSEDADGVILPDTAAPAASDGTGGLVVERLEEPLPDEEWNFSREWRFEPRGKDRPEYEIEQIGSLNPALNVMHGFMLIVLIFISAHYLLGSLFTDRKDRSILFWRSMPVSEWEEVLVRLGVALVVAPAIYIAVSLLLQMAFVLLAMLLMWRMDMDPFVTVLGNIRYADLLLHLLGGWLMTALWLAPAYAWLMLASAWARRSPFMLAVVPLVGLVVVERILFGTGFVPGAIMNHAPDFVGGRVESGFSLNPAYWQQFDLFSLLCGLVFAAGAVVACVYLRRYRFEL
ncbi:hypothetical protein F0M18_02765 [Pseudohalioglobus sediminis]|uniref:ABC transporter permease n=1 Tax=Pseudohalioglobus sediminis TaxID=2606449 RepID=A0A5B0X889_9GAMM|nr:hypothetical protein [Pseudohalioglobus sediminis]KAA1194369.1 hypothetical protein F0M18_02765 [Pseudohalioglobus sediminis]